jgi:hypothetical protein
MLHFRKLSVSTSHPRLAFFCRYSFESKSWSSIPSLPSPKGFGAAAECNGTLYAAPRFRLRRTKITKARTDSSSAVLQMVMSLTRCRCETVGLLARDGDEYVFQFGHNLFYRVLVASKAFFYTFLFCL